MISHRLTLIEPEHAHETPVLVEVPHASTYVDPASAGLLRNSIRSVARDADLYVDDIFEHAPRTGATLLVAGISRHVIDLNRAKSDVDGASVLGAVGPPNPRGLIWRTSTDGETILGRRLTPGELERRVEAFYDPYHRKLTEILQRKVDRFGYAVLLCAHSMPSSGFRGSINVGLGRADLVPGSRGRTTAHGELLDRMDELSKAFGFTVAHDDPYKGGYSTATYGRPSQGVHAVQLEIARRLYMDEEELTVNQGFADMERFAREICLELARPLVLSGASLSVDSF